MFDSGKTGKIEKEKVRTILNTLGHTYDDCELDALLAAEDTEGNRESSSCLINQRLKLHGLHDSTLLIISHGTQLAFSN